MSGDSDLLGAAPGLARIAFAAWVRTSAWTLHASTRAGGRVMRAALNGEPPTELFADAADELRRVARIALDLVDSEGQPRTDPAPPPPREPEHRPVDLRERGADLLRRSADVRESDEGHPAYELIIEQLAPDEARILRLLHMAGPQPAVDVRSGSLPLAGATELIEPGLTMLGAEAGCRRLDRVPAYLNNLYRLGLIWFSREALKDITRYQVLEAQPAVAEALERAGRGRTVRRSIQLTPFGGDFCDLVLPATTAEFEALT